MIEKIEIKNFKSIADLSFELGRVNVLIGANGTGKSNILEAIAFGGAAAADKLDNEFLASRGIRNTDSNLMRSAFDTFKNTQDIELYFNNNGPFDGIAFSFDKTTGPYSKWINRLPDKMEEFIEKLFTGSYEELSKKISDPKFDEMYKTVIEPAKGFFTSEGVNGNILKSIVKPFLQNMFSDYGLKETLGVFFIYAPENSTIRNFEKEGQIQPLGIYGEGLFKLLKNIAETQPEKLQKINEKLRLIEWFDGFEIPTGLIADQAYLKIKDRYLDETLQNFDQRSSNEGFLFLLFYFTLFIADETPKFFAVDNVDAALNPKLAAKLMQELVVLSKEHDKQVILTTHNPALLDGLDLTDDEVRLFVVYRSVEGHTTLKRVTRQKPRSGKEQVPLSEAFLRGYIGGLPSNF